MDWKGVLLVLALILLILPVVSAEKHMKLLAIEEGPNATRGNLADLYLRIVDGTGDVYVATFPLTRIDTQISARYAKDVSCETFDHPCDSDFLYTLKAKTNLIGGPSAGSAIAVLTVAELDDLDLNNSVAITGTINSGGLIGPVGSLMEKIKAAHRGNITTVLIPEGTRHVENKTTKYLFEKLVKAKEEGMPIEGLVNQTGNNETIDLVEYGETLGLRVVEVSRLEEALSYFTNQPYSPESVELEIDPEYEQTMRKLAHSLCERTDILRETIAQKGKEGGNEDIIEDTENNTRQALEFIDQGNYYSAASFCFGSNVRYRKILYRDLQPEDFVDEANEIAKIILTGNNYQSLRNLQTFIIVKQRLAERDELVDQAIELFNKYKKGKAQLEEAQDYLAFARERLHSALAWSSFFRIGEKDERIISREAMKETCSKKLGEAEERFQYASIYYPLEQEETEKEIQNAVDHAKKGNYELCIASATKAKAESDVILSVIGVKKDQLPNIIREKLAVAKQEIASQDTFPIVAYSYYQYAQSLLHEEDHYSALLYAEYALEMSNLDVYFKETKVQMKIRKGNLYCLLFFLLGIGIGMVIYHLITSKKPGKRKNIKGKKSRTRPKARTAKTKKTCSRNRSR